MAKLLNSLKGIFVNLLTFLSYVFILGLVFIAFFRPDIISWLIEYLKQAVLNLWWRNWVILALSTFGESIPILGSLLPGQTIILIVGGVLWGINFFIVLAVVIFFTLAWNVAGFLLGRKYGKILINKYGHLIGIWETELKYLKKGTDKYGPYIIVLGKFHWNLRSFIPFAVGMGEFPFNNFIIWNIVASVLRAMVMLVVGVFLTQYYEMFFKYLSWGFLLLFVGIWVRIWYRKPDFFKTYIHEKEKELTFKKISPDSKE